MDIKNIGGLVGGLVVVILLLTAILIPVVSSTSIQMYDKTTVNQENVSNRVNLVDTLEMTQDGSAHTIAVNDVTLDNSDGYTLLITDKVIVSSFVVSSSVTTNPTFGIWTVDNKGLTMSQPSNDIEITLENGTLTIVYGSSSTTETYDVAFAYVYDTNGEYAVINETYLTAVHLNNNQEITLFYNGGWWTNSYTPVAVTADDGEITATATKYAANSTTGVDDTVTIVFEETGYDVLLLSSITPTKIRAIVPFEYDTYSETAESNLLEIIPLLIVVGLILSIVGAVIVRRE